MTKQTVIDGHAFSVLHDSGYSVWQAWPLELEYTKTDDGRYLITGDPLHVRVALAIEAVRARFAKAFERIPEDDEDAMGRHFDNEWRALHRAVAPLFVALVKAKPLRTTQARKAA